MWLARRVLSSSGAKALLVVLALVGAYQLWMWATASQRIEPGLLVKAESDGRIPVDIVLRFKAERFHVLKVQELGRVRRVVDNVIKVRVIDAPGIQALARNYYWIEQIRTPQEDQQ